MEKVLQPVVSVILSAYQARNSVARAVSRLLDSVPPAVLELVAVDDCSTDGTYEILLDLQKRYPNLSVFRTPSNSGSPSAPRNLGMQQAKGTYITILDDDDYIDAVALLEMARCAQYAGWDLVKGYLHMQTTKGISLANRLTPPPAPGRDTIIQIISQQSMTCDFLVSRELLLQCGVTYDTTLRVGEDALFLSQLLTAAKLPAYVDIGFLTYCRDGQDADNLSSTQIMSDNILRQQLSSWRRVHEVLQAVDLDFYELRLRPVFASLLVRMVLHGEGGFSPEAFQELCDFAASCKKTLDLLDLAPRYRELMSTIFSRNYKSFCRRIRPRVVIAGMDLKFIEPVKAALAEDYDVRVDEWLGHNWHDPAQSKKALAWADIVWCEWLLGNAVWYVKNKKPYQKLFIRTHRFEITRAFGSLIDWSRVDALMTVSYYYIEKFAEEFHVPRSIMRLLPNGVPDDKLTPTPRDEKSRTIISLVGALPKLKGLHRAYELLKTLRAHGPFELRVYGNLPGEISWIQKDPAEGEYYTACEEYAKANGLSDHITWMGKKPLAELYGDIGFVLSLSDPLEFGESFHLAPAEASCAGAMGLILRWRGSEYIYPREFIFDSIDDMAPVILRAARDGDYHAACSQQLREHLIAHSGNQAFSQTIKRLLRQGRISS